MKPVSASRQRLLAIMLLLLCLCAAWVLLVLPIINGFADRSVEREDLQARYVRNDRLIASIPVWRREIKQQKKTQSRYALVVPSAPVGREALTKRLTQTVLGVGGTVLSTNATITSLPPNWISVQGDVQLSIGQLSQMLTRFQSEEPYVVVEFLSVGVIPARQPGEPQRLAVRVTISALLHVDPAAAKSGAATGHA